MRGSRMKLRGSRANPTHPPAIGPSAAGHQVSCVIVDDHREQACSYRGPGKIAVNAFAAIPVGASTLAKNPSTISAHVFTASAAMVGVCITVIGIFQVVTTLRSEDSLGDDFLAMNAILYLITTLLSYWALRTSNVNRNHFLEKLVDVLFLIALTCTTAIAGFITWAITVH